nr:MAG TPA: Protein of unknown function (DUF1492) [Caudoviricetes sp.]
MLSHSYEKIAKICCLLILYRSVSYLAKDKLFLEAEKKLDKYREYLIVIENLTILIQAKLDLYSTKGLPGERAICYDSIRVSKTNSSPIEEWLLNNDKEYDVLITRKSKLVKEVNLMKNTLKILNSKELKVIEDRYVDRMSWNEIARHVKYSESHCKKLRNNAIDKIKNII